MSFKLPGFVKSVSDRDKFVAELEKLLLGSIELKNLPEEAQKFIEGIESSQISKEDNLKNSIEYLKNIEILHLTLAIEPSDELVKKICDFLLQTIKDDFLIDIDTDINGLGGVIVSWKGKYLNLSLDKKLTLYFNA